LDYKLFENEIESKTVANWQMIKTILWKWPGEHAASGTFKKLQAKVALGKVVDNSIAPTECTKARCFDTLNRNFFYRWGADEALTARCKLLQWGPGRSPSCKRIL